MSELYERKANPRRVPPREEQYKQTRNAAVDAVQSAIAAADSEAEASQLSDRPSPVHLL